MSVTMYVYMYKGSDENISFYVIHITKRIVLFSDMHCVHNNTTLLSWYRRSRRYPGRLSDDMVIWRPYDFFFSRRLVWVGKIFCSRRRPRTYRKIFWRVHKREECISFHVRSFALVEWWQVGYIWHESCSVDRDVNRNLVANEEAVVLFAHEAAQCLLGVKLLN